MILRVALFYLAALLMHGSTYAAPPASVSKPIKPVDVKLRYDGAYWAPWRTLTDSGDVQDGWHYFRFNPFGTVNVVTLSGDLDDAQWWFDNLDSHDNGNVHVEGNQMRYHYRPKYDLRSDPEEARFEGRISPNRLDLIVKRGDDKSGAKVLYKFVKLHDIFRDCNTPNGELENFEVFYARFAHDEKFALSRTRVPLLTKPVPASSSPISAWDLYLKEKSLPRRTRMRNSNVFYMAMWDTVYYFRRLEKCWIFVDAQLAVRTDRDLVRTVMSAEVQAQTVAELIDSLHTTRNRGLYYDWNSLPDNVRELGQRNGAETIAQLVAAYLADRTDQLFRFNVIMILNHILKTQNPTESEISDIAKCLVAAFKDAWGNVRLEAVWGLKFTGKRKYEADARLLLGDEHQGVRIEAGETVKTLGGGK